MLELLWIFSIILTFSLTFATQSFPTCKDHAEVEIEMVSAMIESIFIEVHGKSNPIIVSNCRAGFGRTGTLLTALHFYQLIQRGEEDPNKYTLEAIVVVINEFLEK